jgi:hypothetical protein
MYLLHAINSDRQTRLLKVFGQIVMFRDSYRNICSSDNLKVKQTNIVSCATVRESDVLTWCLPIMSHVYFRLKLRRDCEFPSTAVKFYCVSCLRNDYSSFTVSRNIWKLSDIITKKLWLPIKLLAVSMQDTTMEVRLTNWLTWLVVGTFTLNSVLR